MPAWPTKRARSAETSLYVTMDSAKKHPTATVVEMISKRKPRKGR